MSPDFKMSVRFFCQDEKISVVDCFQGLNLLGHAQMEEIETGSECGGHGRCGKDRVKISALDSKKLNPPTEIEKKHLSVQEIEEGWRLACQAFPSADGLDMDVVIGSRKVR